MFFLGNVQDHPAVRTLQHCQIRRLKQEFLNGKTKFSLQAFNLCTFGISCWMFGHCQSTITVWTLSGAADGIESSASSHCWGWANLKVNPILNKSLKTPGGSEENSFYVTKLLKRCPATPRKFRKFQFRPLVCIPPRLNDSS